MLSRWHIPRNWEKVAQMRNSEVFSVYLAPNSLSCGKKTQPKPQKTTKPQKDKTWINWILLGPLHSLDSSLTETSDQYWHNFCLLIEAAFFLKCCVRTENKIVSTSLFHVHYFPVAEQKGLCLPTLWPQHPVVGEKEPQMGWLPLETRGPAELGLGSQHSNTWVCGRKWCKLNYFRELGGVSGKWCGLKPLTAGAPLTRVLGCG